VALSGDGRDLVSASKDGTVRVWDLKNLAADKTLEPLAGYTAHAGASNFMTALITPDGRRVVSAGDDGKIIVWDLETRSILHRFEERVDNQRAIITLSPDPEAGLLAAGLQNGTFKIWDLQTGAMLAKLEGHAIGPRSPVFSPDGKLLATAGKDSKIMIWNVQSGTREALLEGHSHWLRLLKFSPDGRLLFSAGVFDNTVNVWERRQDNGAGGWERKCSRILNDRPVSLDYQESHRLIAVGSRDGKIWLMNPAADDQGKCQTLISMPAGPGSVDVIAFLPAEKTFRLLTGDNQGVVQILPFASAFLHDNPEELYMKAQTETGLEVEGMELVPKLPTSVQKGRDRQRK
jgi:WD40 repeat protein